MTKLDTILTVITVLAVLGISLVVGKAFGLVTISWELAVTPALTAAIGLCITIFLVIFKYLREK